MITGIGAPDDVGGQPSFGLETCKSLERRGGEHPAEIPDHRLDHQLASHVSANRKLASTVSRRRPALKRGSPIFGARCLDSSATDSNVADAIQRSSTIRH